MLIEIKGVQFVNKGAELMLHAIVQQVKQLWPHADIVLAPNVNSPYKARALLGAYQKLPLQKGRFEWHSLGYALSPRLRNWLKLRLGLVTEADIDLVLDASGFAYGDQWPSSSIKLLCAEIRRYAKAGKKYILLPQAFGPFNRLADREILAKTLPMASLVCARDAQSFQYVQDLMSDATNIVCFPDFTNLVKPMIPDDFLQGDSKVLFIPNSNMVTKNSANSAWVANYVPLMAKIVTVVKTLGLTPVFLNHEGEADARLCREIIAIAGGDIELITEPNPLKVKGIIAQSKAVVCSRFHGCVSALAQGVPCLGTSWSHKYEHLFSDYAAEECLLSPNADESNLAGFFIAFLASFNSPERAMQRQVQLHKSELLWQKIYSVVS